jgi:two-component system invasion response regulator UvrY
MAKEQQVIRVGLADDHTMFRRGIISILNESDRFTVVAEGANGKELIQAIEHLKTPPDVCLLDINMPKLNGYETLQHLRAQYPEMKFLVLTMLEHEFVIIKMLRLGANGYLLKEDDPNDLKRAIETVYEKSFYHTDLVNGHLISIVQNGLEYKKIVLSDHEQKFLEYSCSEMTYKEIAVLMKVSARTVEGYRDMLFDKLNVKSRTGLAIYALKLGLATLE